MKNVLGRQIHSNWFQVVRTIYNPFGAPLGAGLEHSPEQTGFFIGLNVFDTVHHLPHDLQVLRALANVFTSCVLVMKVVL
jgi:hypothetical protein